MKRKQASTNAVVKRFKKYNPNASGEVKWTSSAITSDAVVMFSRLSAIDTAGERNGRIGNKVYLTDIHIQGAVKYAGSGAGPITMRMMVVQSKQGELAGSGGATDAPTLWGEANHDAYRVLYDRIVPVQYGDSDLVTPINIRCKINTLLRFKKYPHGEFDADRHIYFWLRSNNEASIGGTVVNLRGQLYWRDV